MKNFSNFAQFKKLITKGSKIKSTFHKGIIGRDEASKNPIYGDKDNGTREVTIVQTNSCAFKTPKYDNVGKFTNFTDSWFYYPKAAEIKVVNNNTLEVYEFDRDGKLLGKVLSYQIED